MASEDVQQAKEAFGARLRELRKEASLTGRALAQLTGLHYTKVSRAENGRQSLTDAEIRAWCAACGADDQAPELVVMARTVESMYREWRRQARAGMRYLQESSAPLYERTRLFRIYEHTALPGLFHTAEYSTEIMSYWVRFLGLPDDAVAATAARLARQKVLPAAPPVRRRLGRAGAPDPRRHAAGDGSAATAPAGGDAAAERERRHHPADGRAVHARAGAVLDLGRRTRHHRDDLGEPGDNPAG